MGILRRMRHLLNPPPPPDPASDTAELLGDSCERLERARREIAGPLRKLARENHIAEAIISQIRERSPR